MEAISIFVLYEFCLLFKYVTKECPSASNVACKISEWGKSLVLCPVRKIKYLETM